MYRVRIHKQVSKKLKTLNAKDRLRITSKVMELATDPDSKILDIKKLIGEPYWRLRVGNWRIYTSHGHNLRFLTCSFLSYATFKS